MHSIIVYPIINQMLTNTTNDMVLIRFLNLFTILNRLKTFQKEKNAEINKKVVNNLAMTETFDYDDLNIIFYVPQSFSTV